MKKNNLLLIISITSYIASIVVFFTIHTKIPIQWSIDGEVSKFATRYMILFIGLLPLLLYFLMSIVFKFEFNHHNFVNFKTYNIIKNTLISTSNIILWIYLGIFLKLNFNIHLLFSVTIGILLIVFGNYMCQFKQNYFIGIRTPWTLSNKNIWRKTHHLGGYLFIIQGLVCIILGFMPSKLLMITIIVFTSFSIALLFLYSYILHIHLKCHSSQKL